MTMAPNSMKPWGSESVRKKTFSPVTAHHTRRLSGAMHAEDEATRDDLMCGWRPTNALPCYAPIPWSVLKPDQDRQMSRWHRTYRAPPGR
jgi:hypothetical protein